MNSVWKSKCRKTPILSSRMIYDDWDSGTRLGRNLLANLKYRMLIYRDRLLEMGWLSRLSIHLQCRRPVFSPRVGKIPWRRKWQPIPYSCLENLMDRGARQVIVHGVTRVRHDWEMGQDGLRAAIGWDQRWGLTHRLWGGNETRSKHSSGTASFWTNLNTNHNSVLESRLS